MRNPTVMEDVLAIERHSDNAASLYREHDIICASRRRMYPLTLSYSNGCWVEDSMILIDLAHRVKEADRAVEAHYASLVNTLRRVCPWRSNAVLTISRLPTPQAFVYLAGLLLFPRHTLRLPELPRALSKAA